MALIKHFNAYIVEKLPFLMQILELFETGDSVKGKMLSYENQINKNVNKTRGDIFNMYGSEALQFFEPLKRALNINYESSCTNGNCVPRDPKPLSRIQVSRSIRNSKNETSNSIKAEVVSYDGCCMTCKSGTVTQRVKSLPEIIVISGDQLKSQEFIPEYLTFNEESNLFMFVLVTFFISGLDHFISLFCFWISTWLHYDGLALVKTKMVKRPTILNGEKPGFLIHVSKKMFCLSNKRKMECPPEEITMNIDEDFLQFKKENENDDLEELKYVEQQNSQRTKKLL